MDTAVAKGLKNKTVNNRFLVVVVANGHKVTSEEECTGVQGRM